MFDHCTCNRCNKEYSSQYASPEQVARSAEAAADHAHCGTWRRCGAVLLRAFSIAAVLPGQPLMPIHIDELTCVCWHTGRTWSTCKAEPWLHPPTKTPSSYLQGRPILLQRHLLQRRALHRRVLHRRVAASHDVACCAPGCCRLLRRRLGGTCPSMACARLSSCLQGPWCRRKAQS